MNGKPLEDFDDDNIAVIKRRPSRVTVTAPSSQFRSYNYNHDGSGDLFATTGNAAFLGVSTEEDDGGAKITNVTEKSAAEKAGLKEDDVITKINETKIEDPNDLTKAIGKYKPEDKVTVTYKRDGKENKKPLLHLVRTKILTATVTLCPRVQLLLNSISTGIKVICMD